MSAQVRIAAGLISFYLGDDIR